MFTAKFPASSSIAAIPVTADISVWTRPCSARTSGTIPGGIGKNTSGKPTINPRASVASRKAGKFPGKGRGRKAPIAGIAGRIYSGKMVSNSLAISLFLLDFLGSGL